MALIGLHELDRWTIGGLRMDTPGFYLTVLDGLRATSTVRVTGTTIPGRHGLAVRPHMDTTSEAIINAKIVVTDRNPETGVQPGARAARRVQFERNLAAVLGAVTAVGRLATVEQLDAEGVTWTAGFRSERSPRVSHDRMGVTAEVEAELVLPGGYLMGPTRSETASGSTHTLATSRGASGPIFDLRVSVPSASTGRVIRDLATGGYCTLVSGSGTWVFDNLAGTSKLGSVSNLANVQSAGTQHFLTLHPAPDSVTGRPTYRISGATGATFTYRETKAV